MMISERWRMKKSRKKNKKMDYKEKESQRRALRKPS